MTIAEFEEAVWRLDGIRIVIRAVSTQEVPTFDKDYAFARNRSLNNFIGSRLRQYVPEEMEIEVIDGRGQRPNRGTLVENVRASYS